jgi:predicted MPP superfamily phosphohydrolase
MGRGGLDRRATLRAIVGGIAGVAVMDAFGVEPVWLEVTEIDVPVPGLPRALEGYRIAHLTDLHLGSLGRVHDAVFEALRARSVQLVALTGDAIDAPKGLATLTLFCHGLAASGAALVATRGNWEHWGGVLWDDLRDAYAKAGVRLLGNESTRVEPGVAVMAVDDHCTQHADPARAFREVPKGDAALLLSHAPGLFDELPEGAPRFHLGLAGHTHGGQVRPFGGGAWLPPGSGRFRAGAYATAKGPIYVSRGVGTSIVRARFACRPELPILRLVAG